MPRKRVSFPHRQAVSPKFGYDEAWLEDIPESSIESFAGTGNPFSLGEIKTGERVVDIESGVGIDSLIAAHKVGPTGQVTGVDMTPTMLDKAPLFNLNRPGAG